MPSKIQLDENLWFLYICMTKSDLKNIDFLAVAAAMNLKPSAARMRYTRLRRQIQSGMLIGTRDGIPESGKKRFRPHGVIHTSDIDKSQEQGRGKQLEKEIVATVNREHPTGDTTEEEDDSEDEVPLARLRKRRCRVIMNDLPEKWSWTMAPRALTRPFSGAAEKATASCICRGEVTKSSDGNKKRAGDERSDSVRDQREMMRHAPRSQQVVRAIKLEEEL